MVDPERCPFCGSKKVGCYESWNLWACQCDECGATMVKRGSKEEAIEAWNRRDGFEAPDGFVLLPNVALEEPKPIIVEMGNGIEVGYDFSGAIRQYAEYFSKKASYDIVTRSLNRAGWFKERTCKVENIRSEGFNGFYVILSCGHRYLTMLSRPFPCCPECGARVVS